MNYRLAKILARKSITADAVETIDIDIRDPISQIVILYEMVAVGGIDLLAHPAKCITKIEIIDGSDVLYSLSGLEAQAVDFYHNKREPANRLTYLNGNTCYEVFQINFGRSLYDPLLALDPNQFTNLQMRISIDLEASIAATAQSYLTVMAHTFDEKIITPTGFLMHKEIKSWNLVADANEYTDLPTDYAYRKLFVKALRASYRPTTQIDQIKISEDNDKKIPINNSSSEILRALIGQTSPYRETLTFPGVLGSKARYITPSYRACFGSAGWVNTAAQGYVNCAFGDGGVVFVYAEATGPNCQLMGEGYLPHGVFEIPFGLQNEIDDWYDVAKVGNLKAIITGGESTGTAELMLQQLRTY